MLSNFNREIFLGPILHGNPRTTKVNNVAHFLGSPKYKLFLIIKTSEF